MVDDYTFRIDQERKEKDLWFGTGVDSPIPHGVRHTFKGLAYYPIDPALLFQLRIAEYPKPEVLTFSTSKGTEQDYLRYGFFAFPVAGQATRLHAYRPAQAFGGRDTLFVPFRDATSAKETYGAGRYLDLDFTLSGLYALDFNRAYNPYCAYTDDYACPFPPPENWLKVPIRAGEKNWAR